MTRALVLIGLALSVSACGGASTLPSPFVGKWDSSPAGCLDPESFDGLTITEDRLQFYEATGDVASVTKAAGGVVEAAVEWADVNDEGADDHPLVQDKVLHLSLSADGSRLTMTMDGTPWTVVRCPVN